MEKMGALRLLSLFETMGLGFEKLLIAIWLATILPIIFASIPYPRLSSFHQLVLGFAKRGKLMQGSSLVSRRRTSRGNTACHLLTYPFPVRQVSRCTKYHYSLTLPKAPLTSFLEKMGVLRLLSLFETMGLGFEKLLIATWLAAIFPILFASIPSPRLNSFHQLVLGFAKRGKLMQGSSLKFTVPQSFFLHFYMVAVVWTTFLLVLTWFYAYKTVPLDSESLQYPMVVSQLTGGSHIFSWGKPPLTLNEQKYRVWRTVFLLLLMELQVGRRLYESIHVFNYSHSARMHIFGYVTGIFFYTAAPLSLCCACVPEVVNFVTRHVAEFIVRGRDKMSILEFDWSGYIEPLTKLGWCQWIGAAIFIWGWIHQSHCHAILGSLREHKGQSDEYVVPQGDWFRYVSCPHYLAEIVIYAGLLIASGGLDLTIWLLFAFVVANLVFAAAETQRWYQRKFENYPQTRRAILPFLY